MNKVVAIIQARCGSTRFPDKVFAELAGKPLIWHVVNRLKFAEKWDKYKLLKISTFFLLTKNTNICIFRQ